jgi:predicted metal-binding protein
MNICEFANKHGIQKCLDFDPKLLVPDQKVRSACRQNRCGNYGKSYMCPPFFQPLSKIKTRLHNFHKGVLLQYAVNLDVKRDLKGVKQSMVEFHSKILEMEEFLKSKGIKEVWGITAGSCGLCEVCRVKTEEPCFHPDKARSSLEALGIDVIALLTTLGLDNQFHDDKVTWTGCVLF